MPDVLGFKLEEAIASLTEAGFQVSTKDITKPPRMIVPPIEGRVVRQRRTGPNQVALVVAFPSPQEMI